MPDYRHAWHPGGTYDKNGILKVTAGHGTKIVGAAKRSEWDIWQRRFWEHLIFDDADYRAHMGLYAYQPSQTRLGEACA